MVSTVRLAVIPGDGIGPEVVAEALKALDAAVARTDVTFEQTPFSLGAARYLETGEWGSAGRALTQDAEVHLAITHMLGHMLGDKLYAALVQGLVPKAKLKELFCAPLDGKGVGLLRYLELVRLTASIDGGQSRGERM